MAKKKIISTKRAPAAIGPYSQAVGAGKFLFLSGQIPLDPETGALDAGGIREQTRRVLDNLKAVLTAGGASLSSVVKTSVYLTDLADFSAFNEIYSTYFEKAPPARSTIQVSALPRGARVEIDAIALVE